MLEVRELRKAFGARAILNGIDLTVGRGDAIALVGGNGCGKTTTLRCIVGLARPDAGTVRVDGIDAAADPRRALQRVSYLPQKPSFPQTLTAGEIVSIAARLRGQPSHAADREIERCGLAGVAAQPVSRLSGGERQRVGLAVTFVADTPVFIFDEPSASLDPPAARLLIERARVLRQEGRAVLFTTHVAADIDALATRVALLQAGRVAMIDDPELQGEPVAAGRPLTAGERALRSLEVPDENVVDARAGRARADVGRLPRWNPGAAAAAAGQR
jgi:ABC-2 type transport system ATP-binding protein